MLRSQVNVKVTVKAALSIFAIWLHSLTSLNILLVFKSEFILPIYKYLPSHWTTGTRDRTEGNSDNMRLVIRVRSTVFSCKNQSNLFSHVDSILSLSLLLEQQHGPSEIKPNSAMLSKDCMTEQAEHFRNTFLG